MPRMILSPALPSILTVIVCPTTEPEVCATTEGPVAGAGPGVGVGGCAGDAAAARKYSAPSGRRCDACERRLQLSLGREAGQVRGVRYACDVALRRVAGELGLGGEAGQV